MRHHSKVLTTFLLIFTLLALFKQEVALGTHGFEKLKHVWEIPLCFAEEVSSCVLLMTNATEVVVVCLRAVLSQKHSETNRLLKLYFNLGCSDSKNKSMYATKKKKETGCHSSANDIQT